MPLIGSVIIAIATVAAVVAVVAAAVITDFKFDLGNEKPLHFLDRRL